MLFDLIVIGSGPAGQRAAIQAAKAGKKVAIVEELPAVGGGCVHTGTLPSKSFRESVYRWTLGSRGKLGQDLARTVPGKQALPDMQRLVKRRHRVVTGQSQIIFDQLRRNGVEVYHGKARFTSANDVEVKSAKGKAPGAPFTTQKLTAQFIMIATGAVPVAPSPVKVDHKRILDSNTILTLKKVPRSMAVLGGGIIGCEYASMFSMAGTKVYLVDRRHEILAAVDREIVSQLMSMFHDHGVEIILEAEAKKLNPTKTGVGIELSNGRKLKVDVVLNAHGRSGNVAGLGLPEIGVEMDDRSQVHVDKHFRTTVPNIYAVGDVVGAPALASTSFEQGRLACCHAFKIDHVTTMPEFFPYGIYTIPEISMIGPTEEQLIEHKVDYVVGRARYKELARGQIVGDRWGILKLLVHRKSLKILGVHIIGDNAADLIHIGQAVMALDGDVNYFRRTVFNYPTLAEAYKTAAFHAFNQIRGTTSTK